MIERELPVSTSSFILGLLISMYGRALSEEILISTMFLLVVGSFL